MKDTLLRRGLFINPACRLYLNDIESMEHLFKDSPMVHKVQDLAAKHSWLLPNLSLPRCQDFFQCLNRIKSSQNPKVIQNWKSTNAMLFNNEIFGPIAYLI